MSDKSYYTSPSALAAYLLLHYGGESDHPMGDFLPNGATRFPSACVHQTFDRKLGKNASRALDLGCAVGRSAFELSTFCDEVIGIDASSVFIEAANRLKRGDALVCEVPAQGVLTSPWKAVAPQTARRDRVAFEVGDAQALRRDLGTFDVVLLANLLCRLPDPRACLRQLPALVRPGGQLVITTPSTWREDYTPRAAWLGGYEDAQGPVRTLQGLHRALEPTFSLVKRLDLPLALREHERKYEVIIAEASVWRRAA